MTEESRLDEFLSTAELAGTEFTAGRLTSHCARGREGRKEGVTKAEEGEGENDIKVCSHSSREAEHQSC